MQALLLAALSQFSPDKLRAQPSLECPLLSHVNGTDYGCVAGQIRGQITPFLAPPQNRTLAARGCRYRAVCLAHLQGAGLKAMIGPLAARALQDTSETLP